MDSNFMTVQFHNEYAKRVEEEHRRQNHRISNLEKAVEENQKLALSIERLTISVQSMVEEQKEQGKRLETLENRDGENWRKAVWTVAASIIGIVVGFVFAQIGM